MRKVYKASPKALWNWEAVTKENLKPILIRWVIASLGMLLFIYFYDPDKLFGIFYYRPEVIPFLLLLYPLLSALPQEFIFCSFFFKRYQALFGTGTKLILASTVMFAYAHLLYINPIAPTLSLIGGYIFATTYYKTRSLALVTIEHGLYGNVLFLVGLGYYFYGGNMQ
jgi:membrane protease YdiL (CAAX protease family)